MYDPKPLPEISEADKRVLSFFAEHAFPPVEATADELVTVKMTSRFEVTEVTIREGALDSSGPKALGQAVKKAVNQAIREVAQRNAQRLEELPPNPSEG